MMSEALDTGLEVVAHLEQPNGLVEVTDPEERARLDKSFDDAEQHDRLFEQHRKRLFAEHEGEFVLVYMDEHGESQLEVGSLKALSKHEGYRQPSAICEWLGFELYA